MFKVLVSIIAVLVITAFAATRTEVTKVSKPDTVISVKADTTKTVNQDTIEITKTFKDSCFSVLVKTDTVVVKQKSKAAVAPAKAPEKAAAPAKATVAPTTPAKPKGK